MSEVEIWLIAISLAMDCLAVSIASGIILKQVSIRPMITMALFFGLFQAMMPLLGWMGANTFQHHVESVDHWIAFSILAFLGLRMVRESFKEADNKSSFNPSDFKIIIWLAIATSIDALAVGVSFAFLDMPRLTDILYPICVIGFASFILSVGGNLFGSCCRYGHKIRVELWGGLILVVIGTKILIQHLFFV